MSEANAFLGESDNIIKNEEGICSSKEIKPPIYLLRGAGKLNFFTVFSTLASLGLKRMLKKSQKVSKNKKS